MERVTETMNEYTKHVELLVSNKSKTLDISKLNNIRKKFGKQELKPSSRHVLRVNSSYIKISSFFTVLVILYSFFNKTNNMQNITNNKNKNNAIGNISIESAVDKLTTDEQALYWTYAIYDFDKFKNTFPIENDINLNKTISKNKLLSILPKVSAYTLETIYNYDHEILNSVSVSINRKLK